MSDLRYPIGPFVPVPALSDEDRRQAIQGIATVPSALRAAVGGLSDEQLDTPYREGGWTVRQLVHHLADSHLNAFIRFKLAVTEDTPEVRPYDQEAWVGTADAAGPVESSLAILDGLHGRWVELLDGLSPEAFQRTFTHPEHPGEHSLDWLLQLYSWHGAHHVAHVTGLRARRNW